MTTDQQTMKHPGTWRWEDDGDIVEGTYVELAEAHTRFDGTAKPILVLEVDGERRTVWLFHTALQSQLRKELLKRPNGLFRVGEPVRIERLGEKESENGRQYVDYRVSFAESPRRRPLDILGGDTDDEPVIVRGEPEKAEPEAGPDDDIPF